MNHTPTRAFAQAVRERYQQLIPRTQHLPPSGSRPLTVAGRVSGWITPKATRVVAGLPGIRIEPEAVHITAAPSKRLPINTVMGQVAAALSEAGCLRGWRDELLDVVGEGRNLAVLERAALRPLGLLTRAVHLNAWTPDGKLWVARRALSKSTDPDMWDTLVGGLACAGETLDESLLRESNEEAGLMPADLENRSELRIILRMHRLLPEGYQVEDVLVSECVLADTVTPENLDGEVSDIQAMALDDLWALVQAGGFTLEAELVVLEGLLKRLQQDV